MPFWHKMYSCITVFWVLFNSNTDELCVFFHRSRPACCRWASLGQRVTSWAGQKRFAHLIAHENIYHVFVWPPHVLIRFFFLMAWVEFPFSSLFASNSSANNKAEATLSSQDHVSWASLGFSTLSCLTTLCAVNLGGSWISVSGDWLD